MDYAVQEVMPPSRGQGEGGREGGREGGSRKGGAWDTAGAVWGD